MKEGGINESPGLMEELGMPWSTLVLLEDHSGASNKYEDVLGEKCSLLKCDHSSGSRGFLSKCNALFLSRA